MRQKILLGATLLLLLGVSIGSYLFVTKYQIDNSMLVAMEEVNPFDYPEDPSHRSIHYSKYGDRHLRLVKKDENHFDFIFESDDPDVATITFKDIDLTLYVPITPKWVRNDPNLEIISLVDREWNRQQVSFPANSPQVEIEGGDGFEKRYLHRAELARNCLNAGLWELLLFTQEDSKKSLYYQGWFTFPLGHYKKIFEEKNNTSYWKHWYRLEHWVDPEGTTVDLDKLRKVVSEKEVAVKHDPEEKLILAGEQLRKSRTFNPSGVRCWGDFCQEERKVEYASFIPPGRYTVGVPWGNEYYRLATLEKAVLRKVKCPSRREILDELELVFRSKDGEEQRFLVSGVSLNRLPQLKVEQYPQGLYMPMGIGVGPFYQSYDQLQRNPPQRSPFFSLLLDEKNRWVNHHDVGIDGPVMHRDVEDPNIVHLYLLSYERHSLFGHYVIHLKG